MKRASTFAFAFVLAACSTSRLPTPNENGAGDDAGDDTATVIPKKAEVVTASIQDLSAAIDASAINLDVGIGDASYLQSLAGDVTVIQLPSQTVIPTEVTIDPAMSGRIVVKPQTTYPMGWLAVAIPWGTAAFAVTGAAVANDVQYLRFDTSAALVVQRVVISAAASGVSAEIDFSGSVDTAMIHVSDAGTACALSIGAATSMTVTCPGAAADAFVITADAGSPLQTAPSLASAAGAVGADGVVASITADATATAPRTWSPPM